MISDGDRIKLLEFLLKLEVDPGFLRDFVEGDRGFRADLVAGVGFEDEELANALADMDSAKLQGFLNPTTITIKGWVKAPPWQ